jgi:hypothetical protein
MAQNITANIFTFTDDSGSVQITYYPHAPGPLIQGQSSGGPRLDYQGPEGSFIFPHAGPGREQVNVQQESPLGSLVSVVLVPSVDASAVALTLLLPPINLAGQDEQDFETVAIKTTSYGKLPREGAQLTYEVSCLQGTARHVLLPLTAPPQQ